MKKALGFILIIPFLIWGGVRMWQAEISFNVQAGGHMQNAANANSVELATKEMENVVKYFEDRHLQPGFTSIFYNTPEENVGFWMANMRASLDELKQVKSDATSLEKSNVLMKLRETLTDKSKSGSEISIPQGISIYPHNFIYMLVGVLSTILAVVGVMLFLVGMDE
ncbi:MAG: hypothetical protein R3B53_02640 [Candidatus Paceibacterota bacterium]